MVTPFEFVELSISNETRKVKFMYPLKSISLVNKGPSSVDVSFNESSFRTIETDNKIEFDSDDKILVHTLLVKSTGTASVEVVGIREINYVPKRELSSNENTQDAILYPREYVERYPDNNQFYITMAIIFSLTLLGLVYLLTKDS